jgi:hypothetical protein
VPPTSKVYFQFQLPGQTSSVRLSGQVVWQDWKGRAGIQFADVPKGSRRLLDQFLSTTSSNVGTQEKVSAVTVELEESFPMLPVPVGVQSELDDAQAAAIGPRQDRRRPDSSDRREQTRHACRLGAEVYRIGIDIPHHCSLTDLSPGGCYLEMPLPFAKKTPIEITIRTHELKLRLRGTTQTSHPGYGMGVAFELETEDQCGQVQNLLDFVAGTIKRSD